MAFAKSLERTIMRRLVFALSAFISLSAAAANAQMLVSTRAPAVSVATGQAARVALSSPVRDVVLGDPQVADVSVINDRTLVVLGKRAGVTSLMAFDAHGRPLVDRQIVVSEAGDDAIVIQRGANGSAYACGVRCARLGPPPAAGAAAAPGVPGAPTP